MDDCAEVVIESTKELDLFNASFSASPIVSGDVMRVPFTDIGVPFEERNLHVRRGELVFTGVHSSEREIRRSENISGCQPALSYSDVTVDGPQPSGVKEFDMDYSGVFKIAEGNFVTLEWKVLAAGLRVKIHEAVG